MGVAMSPLSTNQMAFSYEENPFGKYFKRGLRVSLATDNPLQLHMTNEPLSEEYAIAGQMLKLSDCDLSEIARTSVVISSLPKERKVELIGQFDKHGPECVGSFWLYLRNLAR
jgi:AMP deaminase